MHIIKNILRIFWRIWFYLIIILTIVPVIPLLLVITAKESFFPIFYKITHIWGKSLLFLMGFKADITWDEELIPNKSYMFCANHVSMIDPMLMLVLFANNPFVFVGKIELTKIPIFGFFYKRTMIIVDRENKESRKKVYELAKKRLDKGLSVCIFPEGLVPSDESILLAEFRNGAFVLAIEHQIPIVPISFYDNKKRFSYTFFSGSPGTLRVKIHKPILTKGLNLEKDKDSLKSSVYDLLYNDLKKHE
jgi:1-acyl-sn-glycerol-3-phosphate acyltransferase